MIANPAFCNSWLYASCLPRRPAIVLPNRERTAITPKAPVANPITADPALKAVEATIPNPFITPEATVPNLAPKVPCAAAVAIVCASVAFNNALFAASLAFNPAILVVKALAAALPFFCPAICLVKLASSVF